MALVKVPAKCRYCDNKDEYTIQCDNCYQKNKFDVAPSVQRDFDQAAKEYLFEYLCSKSITDIKEDMAKDVKEMLNEKYGVPGGVKDASKC